MMNKLTRRALLKSIAKLSVASSVASMLPAISGCRSFSNKRITLNVVLHGLFVLDCKTTHIELLTPDVGDHIYMAGNWDYKQVKSMTPRKTYALKGCDSNNIYPTLNVPCNLDFSQSDIGFSVHPDRSLFAVHLPIPSQIRLLRCVYDGPNYLNQNDKFVQIKTFSLCQALIYSVPDFQYLELTEFPWKPQINAKTRTANLHFWAEPPKRLSPAHAAAAYQALSQLTEPFRLFLSTDKTVPVDRTTGVHGLAPEEEQGWSEWASAGETSYPTNCNGVFTH